MIWISFCWPFSGPSTFTHSFSQKENKMNSYKEVVNVYGTVSLSKIVIFCFLFSPFIAPLLSCSLLFVDSSSSRLHHCGPFLSSSVFWSVILLSFFVESAGEPRYRMFARFSPQKIITMVMCFLFLLAWRENNKKTVRTMDKEKMDCCSTFDLNNNHAQRFCFLR